MEVKFLNQPKEIKLGDILNQRLSEKFDEIYLIAGMVKDSGIEVISENIMKAIENKTKINVFIGIDRKNTSKDMLLKLIEQGCNLNVHINTDDNKVEMRVYIFENIKGESYIYLSGAKLSSGGLLENASIVTEIKYKNEERKIFEISKNNILQSALNEFHSVDKDEIILLAEKGEIVARIIDRKIPSITEMYGSKEQVIGEQIYDESARSLVINPEEFEDVDIDIDFGIGIIQNVELEVEKEVKREKKEKEALLKSLTKNESDLEKLYSKKAEEIESKKKPIIHMSNEIDYKNVNTLIIESNKIIEKGVGAGEVKIPKALTDNLIEFFGGLDSYSMMADEKGKHKMTSVVEFEIIDNKDNSKTNDNNVKFILTDKGLSIKSDELIELKLEENDIIRIIKEKKDSYKCEVIRKETEEYNIWNSYLVNTLKGNKRRFGVL